MAWAARAHSLFVLKLLDLQMISFECKYKIYSESCACRSSCWRSEYIYINVSKGINRLQCNNNDDWTTEFNRKSISIASTVITEQQNTTQHIQKPCIQSTKNGHGAIKHNDNNNGQPRLCLLLTSFERIYNLLKYSCNNDMEINVFSTIYFMSLHEESV